MKQAIALFMRIRISLAVVALPEGNIFWLQQHLHVSVSAQRIYVCYCNYLPMSKLPDTVTLRSTAGGKASFPCGLPTHRRREKKVYDTSSSLLGNQILSRDSYVRLDSVHPVNPAGMVSQQLTPTTYEGQGHHRQGQRKNKGKEGHADGRIATAFQDINILIRRILEA